MTEEIKQSVPQNNAVRQKLRDAARSCIREKRLSPPMTLEALRLLALNILRKEFCYCSKHNVVNEDASITDSVSTDFLKTASVDSVIVNLGVVDTEVETNSTIKENAIKDDITNEDKTNESDVCLAWEHYMIIMLNNVLWESFFTHIPRAKRLLLLPFCLRHQECCLADYDELGLICANCGSCSIPKITSKAEEKGMSVLVAESSSSVAEWVETGEIQAVIGVSCLNSLAKAFPTMNRNAVPGLALPLLNDGCKNTSFDKNELLDIIEKEESTPFYQIVPEAIRKKIDHLFSASMVRKYLFPSIHSLPIFSDEILRVLSRHGKHYRPYITYGIYSALTNSSEIPEFMEPVALAVECFHKASLLHDDIEDDDDTRYGEATAHRRFGIPVALNMGDFLVGEGYRLLGHETIPHEIRAELCLQAARAQCELSLGQAREFEIQQENLSLEECLKTHCLKTAPAFRVSLYMGAIATGYFEQYQNVFQRFADSLGVAYQLGDDLADTQANPASIVDCLMREKNCSRNEAREIITKLYNQHRQRTITTLDEITDPLLKIFLWRLTWRVLKDV